MHSRGDHAWLGRLMRGRGDQWASAEINALPWISIHGRRDECMAREIDSHLWRSMCVHGDQYIASEIMRGQGD